MKNQRSSLLTVIILSITAASLLGVWAYLGYMSASFKEELTTIAEEARNKASEAAYLSAIRSALRDAKSDIALIDERFVLKESVPEFITKLEEAAASTGIKADFGGIKIDTAGDSSGGTLKMRMTGTGTWENVLGFVATFDSLPYVARIENINFTKFGGESEARFATSTWNFNIDLVQYLK